MNLTFDGKNLAKNERYLNGMDFFLFQLIKPDGIEVNFNLAHAWFLIPKAGERSKSGKY